MKHLELKRANLPAAPAMRMSRSAYGSAPQLTLLLLLLARVSSAAQGQLACPQPHWQQTPACKYSNTTTLCFLQPTRLQGYWPYLLPNDMLKRYLWCVKMRLL
jgi:hypothetical protein